MTELIFQRFTVGPFHFLRRPVSAPPQDGTVCFVDNGDEQGWTDRCAAEFRSGVWVNANGRTLRFEPTHWIVLEGLGHGDG